MAQLWTTTDLNSLEYHSLEDIFGSKISTCIMKMKKIDQEKASRFILLFPVIIDYF